MARTRQHIKVTEDVITDGVEVQDSEGKTVDTLAKESSPKEEKKQVIINKPLTYYGKTFCVGEKHPESLFSKALDSLLSKEIIKYAK
jgi:hypothetical protein